MDAQVGRLSVIEKQKTISVHRTMDAGFLNSVANDPAVRPTLEGVGALDLTAVLSNPANIALVCEYGGFVLIRQEVGRYDVHSMFLPGNGVGPVKAMRAAQDWMFTRTDCESITSRLPAGNERARGFAIAGGLRTIFSRDGDDYVELTMMDWAMRSTHLETEGERFHTFLEAAKIASGPPLPVHGQDLAHERAVGAAMAMIERGQAPKGVAFYNRWARQAGYATISLVSLSPVTVDVVDAILGLGVNGMEVLSCR